MLRDQCQLSSDCVISVSHLNDDVTRLPSGFEPDVILNGSNENTVANDQLPVTQHVTSSDPSEASRGGQVTLPEQMTSQLTECKTDSSQVTIDGSFRFAVEHVACICEVLYSSGQV